MIHEYKFNTLGTWKKTSTIQLDTAERMFFMKVKGEFLYTIKPGTFYICNVVKATIILKMNLATPCNNVFTTYTNNTIIGTCFMANKMMKLSYKEQEYREQIETSVDMEDMFFRGQMLQSSADQRYVYISYREGMQEFDIIKKTIRHCIKTNGVQWHVMMESDTHLLVM